MGLIPAIKLMAKWSEKFVGGIEIPCIQCVKALLISPGHIKNMGRQFNQPDLLFGRHL